jgi:site-specific recombinase XerD
METYTPQILGGAIVGKVSAVALTSADTVLSDRAIARVTASVAENTRRAYRADWTDFAAWCEECGRSALPATPQTLGEYISARCDQGRAPASISRAISSIRVAHRANDHDPPDALTARAILKAYKQERADSGLSNSKPSAVLSIEHLKKISVALEGKGVMGQRDRLVLVLGWAMMARRGELIALNIADIHERDEGLDVVVRKTKTDQTAEGRKVPIPYGSDPATCPVRLTQAWLAVLASRGITSRPLLRRMDSKGRIAGEMGFGRGICGRVSASLRISAPTIGIILKRAALIAGIPVKNLTPHSLRAGGATGAYLGGADLLSIGRHGGWDDGSPVLAGYIRDVDAWQKNPMYNAGL